MKLYFMVHQVDMDGYLGREWHPMVTDIDTQVALVSAHSYTNGGREVDGTADPNEAWSTVLLCMRSDGTLVELMGHEVVLIPV